MMRGCQDHYDKRDPLCSECARFKPDGVVSENYHDREIQKRDERIAELEEVIYAALRHAEGKGMKDWPVFVRMRKAMKKI